MKRLTKRENGHTHYQRCFEEPCGGMGCRTEDCGFKVEICERLAAYEDTGLEPEEVMPKDKADEIALKLMRLADLESLCNYTRLRELAEADKAGRLVVLPCKVGDTVWITGSVRRLYSEKVRTFFCGDPNYSRGMADNGVKMIRTTGCDIPIHKFGKTVFLTREEAEKALEAMKDG
jgi:hypothetical protein